MATALLLVIFLDFIGLGVPDSLFGAAWPAIYQEFGLPVSYASCVTILVSCGSILSSLLSARLIARFGTARLTMASTALTALALLGFSFAGGLPWLCLLAAPLGLGGGAVDAALNNYVALHYRAAHMNFLHCFYGIGVSVSPYLMSVALGGPGGWRGGYRMAFFLQAGIAAVTVLSLPLWKRHREESRSTQPQEEKTPESPGLRRLARMPAVRAVWAVFFFSCALEMTCGSWGSTFLVEAKGLPAKDAAGLVTFYYAGIALGRFLSGVLASRLSSWKLIRLGMCVVCCAAVLLLLPLPAFAAALGLFLVGLGNGPVYPNLVHLTPQNFGRDLSQAVMGSQMAVSCIGSMLVPASFGLLGQAFGMELFPFAAAALFLAMAVSFVLLQKRIQAGTSPRP